MLIPNTSTQTQNFDGMGSANGQGIGIDNFSITAPLPDYTITTTGNTIVITDISGNGDTLTVSQSVGNIRFEVSPNTRTYSIDGGMVTAFTTPAEVSLAGANSITINAAGGNDVINIGAFTAALPSLIINGGTGDDAVNFNGDINFASDAHLDVELQDDDAMPGEDRVTVASNANLILSGTGAATVKVSRNVTIDSGGSIETANGELVVEANQQTMATSGGFVGVNLSGGELKTTGTGALMVKGKGGDDGGNQYGISLSSGGKINGGSGSVTVTGTGGAGTDVFNFGVYVRNSGSGISSSGGAVSVTGQGGGSGASGANIGVYVFSSGEITAGGSGSVTVSGTGGAGTGSSNYGVFVNGTNARITSSGGDVSVTGMGGGSGASASNYGVYVQFSGEITAGGSGSVTVTGTGGAGTGSDNYGVFVNGTNTRITSSGGDVSVTGMGGGSGASASNYGVYVQFSGEITAGGSGSVTVTGTGGAGTGSSNFGVYVRDSGSRIRSSGGAVIVTGMGGGSGASASNYGVYVQFSGEITAGGSGSVTVTGTGGAGTDVFNFGVYVRDSGSGIRSSGGAVIVTGMSGGSGASGFNYGVYVRSSGEITAGGSGSVTVTGTGGAGTDVFNFGVYVRDSGSRIRSSGGAVIVTGMGGGSGASGFNYGVFVVSSGEITAGGSGGVTVIGTGGAGTGSSNYGVYVVNSGARITSSGGDVSVTGEGGGSGASGANIGVYVFSSGEITAGVNGKVTVNGTGGAGTGSDNYGVFVNGTNTRITSSGGDVSVTGEGGGSGASGANIGVYVFSSGEITAGVNGKVTVTGTGGAGTGSSNFGVYVNGSNTRITSSGGDVSVTGQGGGSVASGANIGVYVTSSGEITAGGSGSVTVTGTGGAGTGSDNYGVFVNDTNTRITSSGGAVIVTGMGGNSAADIIMESGGAITSTSTTAGITLHSAANGTWPNTAGTDVSTDITQTTAFGVGSKLNIDIDGLTANTQYQQLGVVGRIDLNNATLIFAGSTHTPAIGETFIIVDNDGADAVIGTFNGLPEEAIIPNFLGSGLNAKITYVGGDGNDVVLNVVCPEITFTVTVIPLSCIGADDGEIIISDEMGGKAPYMYSINDGATYQIEATFSGLAANTYQVRIKDDNGCESDAEEVEVIVECSISGSIIWHEDMASGVKDAAVNLTGAATGSEFTDVNGDYTISFECVNGTGVVTPVKNINPLNGVNAADVLAIQQHAANIVLITNAFRQIAADVNQNNLISSQDASILNQALKGNAAALAILSNQSWRFVDANWTPVTPPWGFPQSRTVTLDTNDCEIEGVDFVGVKKGDVVVANADPSLRPDAESRIVRLIADDRLLRKGELLTVDVTAGDFRSLAAMQFALRFDQTSLRFVDAEGLQFLPSSSFGLFLTDQGELRNVWTDLTARSASGRSALFRLRFEALRGEVLLSEVMGLHDESLSPSAYSLDLEGYPLAWVWRPAGVLSRQSEDASSLLQTLLPRPVPFAHTLVAGFELPAPGEAHVRLLDIQGRVMSEQKAAFVEGYNEAVFGNLGALPAGVYLCELVSEYGRSTVRVAKAND